MDQIKRPRLLPYLGRFTLLHLVTYFAIGFVFLAFQSALPESGRIAIDFYESFRPLGFMTIAGQILRGLAFALVFYPFYNVLFENPHGRLILFGALWGVALFGSVEPQPGSIEGIIYTTISFTEHLYVLIAVAVQMLLFVWLFFKWETLSRKRTGTVPHSSPENMKTEEGHGSFQSPAYMPEKLRGYTTRFLVVHLLTYWVIGSIFYEISGYADALEEMEIFEMWRPLENIPAVLLVFFGQIFRGTMLALLLAPFYGSYIFKKRGWLLLFLLMFGLTALGSPLFLNEFILFEGNLFEFLKDLVIGIPEIMTQMLVFSLIFFWWQKKAERNKNEQ
ncbi:MAG: hypothetical protein R6U58_08115 [Bacteroidales bacterium]